MRITCEMLNEIYNKTLVDYGKPYEEIIPMSIHIHRWIRSQGLPLDTRSEIYAGISAYFLRGCKED
jgi:hypothetical protein